MISRSGPVCLVVDANPHSLAATIALLEARRLATRGASTLEAAVHCGREVDFDLILCELDVGGVPGGEVAAAFQRIPWQAEVPVIYSCEFQQPEIICRCGADGPVYQVRKPVEPLLLLELAERCRQWIASRSLAILEPPRWLDPILEVAPAVPAPHFATVRQVLADLVPI